MHRLRMCMVCLNHRDELDRSILDLDSGQKGQISMLQSQRQTQDRLVVARIRVYCMYDILLNIVSMRAINIALASFIYTRLFIHVHSYTDYSYVSQGNA